MAYGMRRNTMGRFGMWDSKSEICYLADNAGGMPLVASGMWRIRVERLLIYIHIYMKHLNCPCLQLGCGGVWSEKL